MGVTFDMVGVVRRAGVSKRGRGWCTFETYDGDEFNFSGDVDFKSIPQGLGNPVRVVGKLRGKLYQNRETGFASQTLIVEEFKWAVAK